VGQSAVGRHLLANGADFKRWRVQLPPDLAPDPELANAAKQAVERHLFPKPQIELGQWLSRRARAAAIDVSDGLSLDLHRLCRESGTGARLHAEKLPTAARFTDLCARLELDPLDSMLAGGEDYCLLFSLPTSSRPPASYRCAPIGELTRDRSLRIVAEGRERSLPALGWDHLGATQ